MYFDFIQTIKIRQLRLLPIVGQYNSTLNIGLSSCVMRDASARVSYIPRAKCPTSLRLNVALNRLSIPTSRSRYFNAGLFTI